MTKPYAQGFNGHAIKCDCIICAPLKAEWYAQRIADTSRTMPKPGQTVPVRAYWRTQPNHLNKNPKTKKALEALLSALRNRK